MLKIAQEKSAAKSTPAISSLIWQEKTRQTAEISAGCVAGRNNG
jgi:hypothetical protein